jgi:hypothetical protein
MKFKPKSEREVSSAGLFPPGEYDFEIVEATEDTSKSGNDMIVMKVSIFNQEGQRRFVFDYLVDTDGGAYKIRHCAESVGLLASYERGELEADDLVGKAGTCKVGIQKDKTGNYPDKNVINDYFKPKGAASSATGAPTSRREMASAGGPSWSAPKATDLDDDIPF